ncbi:MAG: GatB/YqeY domain-containing protein [Verrucomicrobia bacterium]|nr:GatB/YqeY domain-containing protein [Verrucomicrobiota bacterium]
MSSLTQRITTDIKEAMKNKDQAALNVIRSLKSAIQLATIEKYGAGGELDEAESVAVIRKAIKQRQDSVASFEAGGRPELAAAEKAEIAVLEQYLPEELSEEEVLKLVEETISTLGATTRKEMGAVMKVLQERIAGRADNKIVSRFVGERLK